MGVSKLYLLSTISEPEQAEIAEKLDLESTTVKQLKAEIDRLKDEKQEATDKSIDSLLNEIDRVSADDVCRVMNKVECDVVYFLKGTAAQE